MPPRRKKISNPFRGVVDMVSEMNRISDRMTGADGVGGQQQTRTHTDAWSPLTDILAEGEDVLIRCELPGVPGEDVEVSFSRGTLSIDGQRRPGPEAAEDFYVQERLYGKFRRDVILPEGIGEKDIEAEFAEGLLLVRVRGCASASGPARINVRGDGSR